MENIRKKLQSFPSSFDVGDIVRSFSNDQKEKIRSKLLHELNSSVDEFSTTMEKVRVLNLLSYLCFILGDKENALDYNRKALETNHCSIIALSNKAWFSLEERKNFRTCEKVCQQLKQLQRDKMANLIAKAEIAFTYSRLGLKHYDKAVHEFKDVIEVIEMENLKENVALSTSKEGNNDSESGESTDSEFVSDYYCVWMYGCALSLQRLCHVTNMHEICDMEQIKVNYKYVMKLYSQILELCAERSKCIQRYKARSYIELGVIAYDVTKKRLSFPRGMLSLFPKISSHMLQTRDYYSKALETFPNDAFVLERSGKYFRYIKEFQLSIEHLKKALVIKETSFGHHHLALSYIRLLELDLQDDLARHFSLMTLDEQSTMRSRTGQNAEENEVESIASCNSESIIYTRPNANYSFENSKRNNIANTQSHFEGKGSQTEHLEPQYKQKWVKNYAGFDRNSVNARPSSKTWSENRSYGQSFRKYPQRETSSFRNENMNNFFGFSGNGRGKCQFENVSQLPPREKYNTRSRGSDRWHGGFNKRLQTRFQSDTTSDDRSNYYRRPKTHFEERKDKSANKCPRDPVLINYEENKDVVDKIFSHLDRATELSTNTSASYDKALLYRQIRQPEKALDILEQLMKTPGDVSSPVMLANIYEQAAFCINAMLDEARAGDVEKIDQLKCDRDMYLKSSLEISCDVVAKFPDLHRCWKSASTLKEILLDRSKKKRTKETLRDLWFLYDKLNSHFEAVGVLKELKDLVEDDEQAEIIEDLVRRYMHLGNYEEAVIALRMTKQLQKSLPTIDQELYCQVHIEAGLDAFKNKHVEKARSRIRQALEFQCGSDARPEEMASDEERFELFVLSNLDCDDAGRKLTTILTELGVKTTFNIDSHSVLPGTPELQGITEMMMKSEAFAILIDFDTENKRMEHITERMQRIKENQKDDPLVVVLTSPGMELSPLSIYADYDTIPMDIAQLSDTEIVLLSDERMCKSIKELLLSVAMRHSAIGKAKK